MNCPHCAETFGWKQVLGKSPCWACGRAIERHDDGRRRTFASTHRDQILGASPGFGYWLLLTVGMAAAGAFPATAELAAFIPGVGPIFAAIIMVVASLALTLLLSFAITRATVRFSEHFDFLHSLCFSLYSSIFLMFFLASQPIVPLIPVAGWLGNALLYLAVWHVTQVYARKHFIEVADGRLPSILELAPILGALLMVLLPPVVAMMVVLFSFYAQG